MDRPVPTVGIGSHLKVQQLQGSTAARIAAQATERRPRFFPNDGTRSEEVWPLVAARAHNPAKRERGSRKAGSRPRNHGRLTAKPAGAQLFCKELLPNGSFKRLIFHTMSKVSRKAAMLMLAAGLLLQPLAGAATCAPVAESAPPCCGSDCQHPAQSTPKQLDQNAPACCEVSSAPPSPLAPVAERTVTRLAGEAADEIQAEPQATLALRADARAPAPRSPGHQSLFTLHCSFLI